MMSARINITHRDLKVVLFVYSTGGVTIDQIQRRWFGGITSKAWCYFRIAQLIKAGYLLSHRISSLSGVGSGKSLLTLGPLGKALVRDALEVSLSEIKRTRLDSPFFLAHHLALLDARISFELACERSSLFNLTEWQDDRALKYEPVKVKVPAKTEPGKEREVAVIPDASFALTLPDGAAETFYLEMDLGTLGPKRVRLKGTAYLLLPQPPAAILFVVPDAARQAHILRWAEESAREVGQHPGLFWVTTRQQLLTRDVLSSPIWLVAGEGLALSLEAVAGAATGTLASPTLTTAPGRERTHPRSDGFFSTAGGLQL